MPLRYNERMIPPDSTAWCGECDYEMDDCHCAKWAAEAAKELRHRREEIIERGLAHPLRRTWVKFLRAQHVWFGGIP